MERAAVMTEVRPRIGLDGYNLALAQGTGVATYARTLGETLAAMGYPLDGLFGLSVPKAAPNALREVLFFGALGQAPPVTPPKPTLRGHIRRALSSPLARHAVQAPVNGVVIAQSHAQRLPPFDRIFTYGSLFVIAARHFRRYRRFLTVRIPGPPEIMHWTYPLPVRLDGARNVYTIHDLVPLRLPQASTEDKAYHYRLIRSCLSRSAHVCTVSNASRRDILEMFPDIDPAKVTNTYQAVVAGGGVQDMAGAELAGKLKRLFDLSPQGYFLFFGALEPKKNLGRLLEAYLGADLGTPLVVVGAGGWRSENELRLLTGAHGTTLAGLSRIRRLDYLPRRLLMLLVRGARAVLFPSLYEGFGLPAVEAMALGTPVLTSNTSCLPEITGAAALQVNPYDVSAIEAGLTRLDRDEALRADLSKAGRVQAERFSATEYASRLSRLYGGLVSAASEAQGQPGHARMLAEVA